jgi:hypothetical protein
MNTVVVGLDNGSKDYLGRREPIKKQGDDPLAKAIAAKWSRLQTIRQKTEALRWEACAYVQHRMNEFSNENSPIKAVKLYNTAGILAFDTFINGYHGNLITPSMRWFKLTFSGENFELLLMPFFSLGCPSLLPYITVGTFSILFMLLFYNFQSSLSISTTEGFPL